MSGKLILLLGCLLAASCGSGDPVSAGGLRRLAILPVENLTGDPSLDWIGDAVPLVLESELRGTPNVIGRARSVSESYGMRPDLLLHSYFERRSGDLYFSFQLEDTHNHKISGQFNKAGNPLPVLGEAGAWIDGDARPFSTQDPGAFEAWAHGDYAAAADLDPGFSTAWLDLIRIQLQTRQLEAARFSVDTALEQQFPSEIDRLELERYDAALRGDHQGEFDALSKLADAIPQDLNLLSQVAEAAMATHHAARSAELYERLVQLDPNQPAFLNQLGYARFLAGDLAGARQALDLYGESPQNHGNALDSQGEVLFMAGHFDQAEQYFVDANTENPNLIDGATLEKAAFARWLGGDPTGADELFNQYAAGRAIVGDPSTPLRQASWLYFTGREDQAVEQLQAVLEGAPSGQQQAAVAAAAEQQLALWSNPDAVLTQPIDAVERAYQQSPPFADGLFRILLAEAALDEGNKERAEELMSRWPLPNAGDLRLEALTFRRFIALRERLALE